MIRVFNSVVHGRILTLFLTETALILGAFFAAVYLDPDLESPPIFLIYDAGLVRIAIVVAVILLGLYFRGFYAQVRIRSRVFVFVELCAIFGLALVGQGLLSYVHKDWTIPRKVALGGTVLALVASYCWRLLFDIAAKGAVDARPALFLGLSPTVSYLAGFFAKNPEYGLKPIGFLEGGSGGPTQLDGMPPASMPRLGSLDDLSAVLDATRPASIVIGRREDIKPEWAHEFLELRFAGVNAEQAATLYEKTFGRVCAAEIWPSKMIFGDTWKTRSVDITVQTIYSKLIAAAGLIVLGPFGLLAAILIRIGSRGPILLRETRIGMHNVPFTRYRLRCETVPGREITAIGRLLRRTGLDALPQLLNVMRGEMAIAGPMPDRPEFAQWLTENIPFYRQRHEVKPGLTGWASIHYDSEMTERDVLRRLEYDLYYVKKFSPAMDSLVLLLALKIKLLGK